MKQLITQKRGANLFNECMFQKNTQRMRVIDKLIKLYCVWFKHIFHRTNEFFAATLAFIRLKKQTTTKIQFELRVINEMSADYQNIYEVIHVEYL